MDARAALGLVMLAGCSSSPTTVMPDSSTQFEYTAKTEWSMQATPDITSVTIDGDAVASGALYTLDERYASYQAALASPIAHPVVVTTSTGTLTFELQMLSWPCKDWMTDAPVAKQADQFWLSTGFDGHLGLEAYEGSCENSAGRVIEWAAAR